MFTLAKGITKKVQADETARLLVGTIKANIREEVPQKLLADRLQELGVSGSSAAKWVRALVLRHLPFSEWSERELKALLKGTSLEAINAALTRANGRRRERTLGTSGVLGACLRARLEGWAVEGGGTVANAYKYPATQTGFACAISSSGRLHWWVDECPASKGTSVSNRLVGLTARATGADWRARADAKEQMEGSLMGSV